MSDGPIRTVATADGELLTLTQLGRDDRGQLDPDILRHQIERAGHEKADTEAACQLLVKSTPSLLAKLIVEEMRADPKMPRRTAQDIAMASPIYAEHLAAAVEAERLYQRANTRWKAALAYCDAMRTMHADRRADRRGQ